MAYHAPVIPEAPLTHTGVGLAAAGPGWFVLNAREAHWRDREGRGKSLPFEGRADFPQVGICLFVLGPGEPIGMYHWEADQEDFLVLSGEALLIIEGKEHTLRQWDFVHCPAETKHVIVGAGTVPCLVLAVGARDRSTGPDWGGYTVDEAAARHGASVAKDTTAPAEAYAPFAPRRPSPYREGWLPD